MTNEIHAEVNALHSKKEMKRSVADKLQVALPEMESTLGEKKFRHRLKKAVKMLLHGVHNDDVVKKAKKNADANKAKSAKSLGATKVKATKKAKKVKAAMPELL